MFFYKKLKKDLFVEPMFLGPNLMTIVRERIFSEVEGTCLGKFGYVVSVRWSSMLVSMVLLIVLSL